jgi:hypothetical protein
LVSVVQVEWHATNAMTVTYDDGRGVLRNELLFRSDEDRIGVVDGGVVWSLDGNPNRFRLVSETPRIRLTCLFEPSFAISTLRIDPTAAPDYGGVRAVFRASHFDICSPMTLARARRS